MSLYNCQMGEEEIMEGDIQLEEAVEEVCIISRFPREKKPRK